MRPSHHLPTALGLQEKRNLQVSRQAGLMVPAVLAAPLGLAHRLENPGLDVSGLGKQSQIRENVLGNCSTAQEGGC